MAFLNHKMVNNAMMETLIIMMDAQQIVDLIIEMEGLIASQEMVKLFVNNSAFVQVAVNFPSNLFLLVLFQF